MNHSTFQNVCNVKFDVSAAAAYEVKISEGVSGTPLNTFLMCMLNILLLLINNNSNMQPQGCLTHHRVGAKQSSTHMPQPETHQWDVY